MISNEVGDHFGDVSVSVKKSKREILFFLDVIEWISHGLKALAAAERASDTKKC